MNRKVAKVRNVTFTKGYEYHAYKKGLNRTVDIISYVYPLSILPQLYEIWVNQNTAGVSVITWGTFLIFTIVLLVYTISNNDKRLTVMYSLFLITYIAVFAGLLMF